MNTPLAVPPSQPQSPAVMTHSMTPLRCPTEMQFYTPSSTNLFIRYLPREVDDERLREIFSAYGTITSSMVMRDIHSGQSMGTAFVRFSKHQEALQALCRAHGMPLFGKSISVQWAKQQHDVTPAGQERLKMNKLFLRNVPLDVTEKDVVNLVAPYGTVKKVTLHNDTAPIMDINARRRIVFVTFVEDGSAESALRAVHNTCPFTQCYGVPLMGKLINDAIKSKKHRGRSDSCGSQSNEEAPAAVPMALTAPMPVMPLENSVPVLAAAAAAPVVPASPSAAASRAAERMGGLCKLSLESLNTCPSTPFVSGADESAATTPARSYGTSQWDVAPAATTPVGAFSGPIPIPVGTPSSSSSHHGSTGEASHSSRFCHNPYSMGGEKIFL
jgi:RNA recognition motif-containing protein